MIQKKLCEVARRLRGLGSDEGIAVTEYGLLLALIAFAVLAAVSVFAERISFWFLQHAGNITTV